MLSLSVCVLLCCIVLPQNIKCVDQDEKITKIAAEFRKYGKLELDAWKNNKNNEITNYNYEKDEHRQILLSNVSSVYMYAVAGILSMGEVKNKAVDKLVKNLSHENCTRLMFLNNVIAEPPSTFTKEYDHQEKQLVDTYFREMKNCYEQTHPDDKGVIILYSWYIPCYKPTEKQNYSCSIELAKYVSDRDKHDTDKYEHFYVVYSYIFRREDEKKRRCSGTNEGQSTKTMLQSGIKLGRLNYEKRDVNIKWMKLGGVLQQYLYDCLIIYSRPCKKTTFGCSDSRIVAYAVNFAMSRCVNQPQLVGRPPSELGRDSTFLEPCLINKWIEQHLPKKYNPHISSNYTKFDFFCIRHYATSCVKQAILYAGSTGRSDSRDLSKPSWDSKAQTYAGNNGVVAIDIEVFRRQSAYPKCPNGHYHPETLCTRAR